MAELVYPPVIGFRPHRLQGAGAAADIGGAENVPREGGAVLVSNHIGYLDFLFCGLAAGRQAAGAVHGEESVFRHRSRVR